MNSRYKIKVGLEIHVQMNSPCKLFSQSMNSFSEISNTQVTNLDAGIFGSLPVLNLHPMQQAIKIVKLFNGKINDLVAFDRKHYLYPDLPLGYQITQVRYPLGLGGSVTIPTKTGTKVISLQQIHVEQDAGKLNYKTDTLVEVDFNRAGCPLAEIVTNPDFDDADDVVCFLKLLAATLQANDIMSQGMELGGLRADVNFSLVGEGYNTARTEIKNLNSFRDVHRAIKAEKQRQMQLLANNQPIESVTLKFDGNNLSVMRQKAKHDYRYIAEHNILPFDSKVLTLNCAESLTTNLFEEALDLVEKDLTLEQSLTLVTAGWVYEAFKHVIQNYDYALKDVLAFFLGFVLSAANAEHPNKIHFIKLITPLMIEKLASKKIIQANSRVLFNEFVVDHFFDDATDLQAHQADFEARLNQMLVKELDYEHLIQKTIQEHSELVAKVKLDPQKMNALIGQIMKMAPNANPTKVRDVLKSHLML